MSWRFVEGVSGLEYRIAGHGYSVAWDGWFTKKEKEGDRQ